MKNMTYKPYFFSKMNIAILISGYMSTYEKCLPNIVLTIFKPLKNAGYNLDIFTSTWYASGEWSERTQNLLTNTSTIVEHDYEKLENFIHMYGATPNIKPDPNLTFPRAVSMWYKVSCAYLMAKNYSENKHKKYDIIIHLRPDVIYHTPFDVSWVKSLKKNTVYMAYYNEKDSKNTYELMDHFAFGDANSMDDYCTTYTSVDRRLYQKDYEYTRQGLLKGRLDDRNIEVERIPIQYSIVRPDGTEERKTVKN